MLSPSGLLLLRLMTKKPDDVKEQLKDIKSTSVPPFPLFTTFRERKFSETPIQLRAPLSNRTGAKGHLAPVAYPCRTGAIMVLAP